MMDRDAEIQQVKRQNVMTYKEQLDAQRKQTEQLRAYGNMSAAEKAMNRDDLQNFKTSKLANNSMIPGIHNIQFSRGASPDHSKTGMSITGKNRKDMDEKFNDNVELFKQHGASHLGQGLKQNQIQIISFSHT